MSPRQNLDDVLGEPGAGKNTLVPPFKRVLVYGAEEADRRAPPLWTAARNNVHCFSSAASTSSPGAVLSGCVPVSTRRELEGSTYVENALDLFSTAGSVKRKVAPLPSSDSTQIFPPSRSINFRQNAKPIPLPGRSAPCKRLNGSKIRE
jgi:hypothetical protein